MECCSHRRNDPGDKPGFCAAKQTSARCWSDKGSNGCGDSDGNCSLRGNAKRSGLYGCKSEEAAGE